MKIIRWFLATSLLFLFFLSACQHLAESNAPKSTGAETSTAISDVSPPTETLEILSTATLTQVANDCTVDNQLPNPDIPENYIGWKPSVDFADLYEQENGEGDYVYWESLLSRHPDFAVTGYRRSDNSYMIFFEKVVCGNTNKNRIYKIVDAIRTRSLSVSEDIAPPNFECYRFEQDGEQEQVFAIVDGQSANAVLAWRMDVQSQSIQETSLEAITCFPFGITAPSK